MLKNLKNRGALFATCLIAALAVATPAGAIIQGADRWRFGDGTVLLETEAAKLAGLTAGTVTASKFLLPDANKDLAALRNLTVTNLDAGASGTAGTVDVFPTTASKGKIQLAAADSAGNTTTTITNASQAAARTYTLPDAGASANFLFTTGAATALTSTTTAMQQVFTSYGTVNFDRSVKVAKVALVNSGTGILNWQNPEATAILVTRLVLDITTQTSVGGATADFGIGTTGASSDVLIDGLDINAAAGVFDNVENQGTNGKSSGKVAATTGFVTGTASGTPTALVGNAYIYYHTI